MTPFNVMILTGDDPSLYRPLHVEGVEIHVRPPAEAMAQIDRMDAVVAGWFSRELLERAERLRYFLVPFAGLPAQLGALLLGRPGLCVANSHHNAEFVAEHVFAMLFHLCRNLRGMDRYMRRPALLRRRRPAVDFVALKDKTMGIVGRGHIGRAVEARALAFGMECLSYSRGDYVKERPGKEGLYALLRRSAVVVLCLALTEETRGMIGAAELGCMGGDALLVNVSRGEVVEERALFEALRGGRIRGAGIDAWYNETEGDFRPEKPYAHPFNRLSNVLMTPHVAYRADTQQAEKLKSIGAFIREAAEGGPVSGRIDPSRGY